MTQVYTIPEIYRQDKQMTASDPRTRRYLHRKSRRSVRSLTRFLPRLSRLELAEIDAQVVGGRKWR